MLQGKTTKNAELKKLLWLMCSIMVGVFLVVGTSFITSCTKKPIRQTVINNIKQTQHMEVFTKQTTEVMQIQMTIVTGETNININLDDITNLVINSRTNMSSNWIFTNSSVISNW